MIVYHNTGHHALKIVFCEQTFYSNTVEKHLRAKEIHRQKPQPAPGEPGGRRRLPRAITFIALVLALRLAEEGIIPAIEDHAHEPTRQEAGIAAVVNAVGEQLTGEEMSVKVRCVPGYTEEGQNARTHGFLGWRLPMIRMDQEICDTLTGIQHGPSAPRDSQQATTLYEQHVKEAWAIQTITHELSHYVYPIDMPTILRLRQEGVIVCYATQIGGLMAKGFGMDDRAANRVAIANAQYQYADSDYRPPEECVPGGKYDLGIPRLPGAGYGGGGYFPLRSAI